ncbi:MAG: ABC transporter permease, partial [Zetaproteobacteria bacterium]|nr:ABC transporter permease [Zetaproteobacteria bacterium]
AQGYAHAGLRSGTIVAGLVAIIVAEVLMPQCSLLGRLFSVCIGSVIFRWAVGIALSLDTGAAWYSLQSSDLNMITSAVVLMMLIAPRWMRSLK